jgi:hypothetical protein
MNASEGSTLKEKIETSLDHGRKLYFWPEGCLVSVIGPAGELNEPIQEPDPIDPILELAIPAGQTSVAIQKLLARLTAAELAVKELAP